MKEDAPAPEQVPKKRRQLKGAPDLWLRQWLSREGLTPSERRRVQEELDERKKATPDTKVGIILGREGMTPEQVLSFSQVVNGLKGKAGELHHTWHPFKPMHTTCVRSGIPTVVHGQGARLAQSEIVKLSDLVVALPKESTMPPHKKDQVPPLSEFLKINPDEGVWGMIKYARHRRTPVVVIQPDGKVVR